jgi:general secretion pathway protein G
MRRPRGKGLTTIELLAALGVLMVLATVAIPLKHWDEKRRREEHLRISLRMMRGAIDQYKRYADEGRIQMSDVDQRGFPRELDELVEGVDLSDPSGGETKKVRLLHRVPIDPFTGDTEWGLRSYQDDWDATSWGGENVWDVYSLAPGKALDGTYYKDW